MCEQSSGNRFPSRSRSFGMRCRACSCCMIVLLLALLSSPTFIIRCGMCDCRELRVFPLARVMLYI